MQHDTTDSAANEIPEWQQRFWRKVNKCGPNGCWLWTGAKAASRYGKLQRNGKWLVAHRVSYEIFHGPIPDGMYICHKCNTPLCVNPNHLYAGTQDDNMQDMIRAGHSAKGSKNHLAKLTKDQVAEIRHLFAQRNKPTYQSVGRIFGVSTATIRQIIIGKSWKHV